MITEKDLQEAIAECQGQRNPNASTAIKLAAFLTIQREMFGYSPPPETPISRASGAVTVGEYGNSEFLQAVADMTPADAWAVVDEFMDTIKMINPRVYDGVMRKLKP